MLNVSKIAVGLFLAALAIAVTLPYANAQFVHPRGILTVLSDQTLTLVYNEPGQYSVDLVLAIMPPWYFVPDLTTFDTVTLTFRMVSQESISCCNIPKTPANSPTLLTNPLQWTDVVISQDENGAVVGSTLYATLTFAIDSNTRPGFYLLYMNAQATAGDATFLGFDQVGVAIKPGLLCFPVGECPGSG